jgi:TonB family protein
MVNGSGHLNSAVDAPVRPKPVPPRFLLELEPAHRVFFRNLADTLLFRKPSGAEITSAPGSFWPDVFVPSRRPWPQFAESLLLHVVVLSAVWAAGRAWALRPQIVPRAAFYKEDVIYYSPSEYLPPIDTGNSPAQQPEKGQPEYAKQPIISVPREADNRSQTIITPPNIKLDHDVPLPNVVSWGQTLPTPPLPDANPREMPAMTASIVAPPPDLTQAVTRQVDTQSQVVAPAPSVSSTGTRSVPVVATAVVAPPPTVQRDIRNVGDIDIARADVVAPAPQLPVGAQRTVGGVTFASDQARIVPPPPSLTSGSGIARGRAGANIASAAAVPPSPSVQGTGSRRATITALSSPVPPSPSVRTSVGGVSSASGRQLIALSLHPAVGPPPADIAGNRRGTFAATPAGKSGAQGTPDVAGDAHAVGHGNGNGGGTGSGRDSALPAGIHVGAGPKGAPASPIAGNPAGSPNGNSLGSGGSTSSTSSDPKLLADNRPMRVNVKPQRAMEAANWPTSEERQVFGDRKSYSMVQNMPNLNSGGGSWVIRFAELKDSAAVAGGELSAPEATHKVDPGYPMELMRQKVKGTVTLYAVIHSDGHVSDVKVLASPDDRLDAFACAALARWQFRPALKNGVPVALEAVVMIPFRPARTF